MTTFLSELDILKNKFQNNKIDHMNLQRAVYDLYRHTKGSDKQNIVFDFIESIVRSDSSEAKWMWPLFFEADIPMWGRLHVFEKRLLAENSLHDYLSSPSDILLKMCATTAYTTFKNLDDSSLVKHFQTDLKHMWLDVFKDVPDFAQTFERELNYWTDWHNKMMSSIPQKVVAPVTNTYSFDVPLSLNCSDPGVLLDIDLSAQVNYLIHEFNSFELHGYMNDVGNDCVKSYMSCSGNVFHISFDYSHPLTSDELMTLQDELEGQLSDGWGESMTPHRTLYDNAEVAIGFDYDNVTCTTPIVDDDLDLLCV